MKFPILAHFQHQVDIVVIFKVVIQLLEGGGGKCKKYNNITV